MNAAFEMSKWLLALSLILLQLHVTTVGSFTTIYRHSDSGRKLFGGYRIVPKTCSTSVGKKNPNRKSGVCMFNYECTQRGGEMIGSCVDGFLFGACCALPGSAETQQLEQIDTQYVTALEPDGNKLHSTSKPTMTNHYAATTQGRPTLVVNSNGEYLNNIYSASGDADQLFGSFIGAASADAPSGQVKPILEQYLGNQNQGGFIDNQGFISVHKYPVADTFLLNPDGSVVVDEADPEKLFTKPAQGVADRKTTTEKTGTFGYETGGFDQNFPGQKLGTGGYNPVDNIGLWNYPMDRPSATTPSAVETRKTTKTKDQDKTELYPVTSASGLILIHTLSNSNKTMKPTPSTSKASTKHSYTKIPRPTVASVEIDDRYPSFHFESYTGISKPPIVITSPVGFDGSGQAISHILEILNNSQKRPEPVPIHHVTSSIQNKPGLSTWVSITENSNKVGATNYPGTSTNYVHGPSFTVQAQKPNKPVPTVIVISPPSTDSSAGLYFTKPNKKPVHTHATKKPVRVTLRPEADVPHILPSGQESLISFPPVRNPDLNVSGLNQVEKPTIVHSGGYPLQDEIIGNIDMLPDNLDLNTVDPDEDYTDFTTPAMEDDKVDTKIHNFVEKIVNSLAGNFQDLEGVLFRNENKTNLPNKNGIELTNVQIGLPGTTTKKPLRRPTVTPSDDQIETGTGTVTKRPTTPIPSIITSKRPLVQIGATKLTTTVKPVKGSTSTATTTVTTRRPPTFIITTRRPTTVTLSSSSATSRRPSTKKPRPTTLKRTTTTTTTTEIPVEEETEPVTQEVSNGFEGVTPDYRRECGVRPLVKKGGRIVGGKGSQFGHYPWQVLVRESTWLGLFTKNKCGGVLITHKYVITAAHCQPGFLASLVAVFGEYDISGELESKKSVVKNVRRVIVHRQYDPATFENDLALLELDSPISYDEHIVPICMPRDGEDYTGRIATVTGWGRLKYGGGVPSVLQEVRVPLIDNSVCQEMFHTAGHQKRIISSFLCAGYANGQRDSCEGDSGGPLMVEREDGHWVLLGTVSHGIKCAAPYLPGVYMRTTYYKPWLKSITGVSS